ncbi:MAG: hypothetical protein LC121_19810 [Anaerolineae bacterium]|nr:hypothetical protein [Anaerolineae bacterium]
MRLERTVLASSPSTSRPSGGLPAGRVTLLHGPESTGKTTLAVLVCKAAVDGAGTWPAPPSMQASGRDYRGSAGVGRYRRMRAEIAPQAHLQPRGNVNPCQLQTDDRRIRQDGI